MNDKLDRHRGLMMTELIVAMIVLTTIMVTFAISLDGFGRLNHYYFTKQRCVAAAQATLDCIAATRKPIDEGDFKRLWPEIDIHIETTEGTGQWKGLTLIKITAVGTSKNKKPKLCLSRYFAQDDIVIIKADKMAVLKER